MGKENTGRNIWPNPLRFFSRDSIWIDGMILKLNMFDSMAYWLRRKGSSYEKEVIEIMKKKLEPGDIFIDVGAQIGYHTLLASKLVEPGGKVIAFEPSATSFEVLEYNIKRNHLNNVKVVNKAVSNHTGQQSFYWSPSRQMYRSVDEFNENKPLIIPCISLSDYLGKSPVDFMKIDVEGAELSVLEGSENILRNQRPLLVCEIWNKAPKDFTPYLAQFGYSFKPIDYKEGEESYNIFAWKNIT